MQKNRNAARMGGVTEKMLSYRLFAIAFNHIAIPIRAPYGANKTTTFIVK